MMTEKIRLKVVGILKQELYPRYSKIFGSTQLGKNDLIIFCDYTSFNISLEHIFTQLETSKGATIQGQIIFKYATNDFLIPLESIPSGFKTICKFEIYSETQLSIVKQLPFISNWYESNEYLFFEDFR